MILADCIVSRCNQLLTCRGPIPKRKDDLKDVGVLANGSIASSEGKIVFVGEDEDLKKNVQLVDGGKHIDGQGYVGLPGFVDSHTHLPFAGSREEVGKKMDLVLCRAPHYLTLVYHFGINPIKHVIKNGNVVLKDGIVMSEKNGEA